MTDMDTTALIYKVLCDHNGCFELEEMRANISTKEDELKSVLGNQDMFTSTVSEGNKLIVAKTKMRLCRDNECNGCSNLHLCKFYLYGTCRFNEGQQCRFCHELTSEYNIRVLREHHLEELDKRELCTLLLQNDNTLLPPVCITYNKGSGEYGYCPDKESCRRLHICERYITGTCAADVDCGRSHDFNEPHPLNTLQQRGVPNELVPSMLSTYRNIQAIQYEEGSRPVCHPPPPPPPQTYLPAPNVVQSETHYIHLQPIIVHSQLTPSMLRNFKLKSRPFVQTKPKSHTKPSSSASPQSKPSKPSKPPTPAPHQSESAKPPPPASHQSKPYKPPTPAPNQSKSSQPPPHQSKSSKPPSPAPHQSKSSNPPPPAPHQSKSSKPPPPTPHQSKSSQPTPHQSKSSKPPPPAPHQSKSSQPAPHQSKSSKPPPPAPNQSKSSQPAPHQSKSSKPPPPAPHQSKSSQPAPHQSKSSKPPPPAPHQSKSSQPAPHQPKTTKAPPSARRR